MSDRERIERALEPERRRHLEVPREIGLKVVTVKLRLRR